MGLQFEPKNSVSKLLDNEDLNNPELEVSNNLGKVPVEFEIGTVIAVNSGAFNATVMITKSTIYEECPILGVYGASFGNDITWLNNLLNAKVLVIKLANIPHILSTIPNLSNHGFLIDGNSPISEKFKYGDEPTTFRKVFKKTYKEGKTGDFLNGDKIIQTTDNVLLALLKGGLAKLKASPMAQIILSRYRDLVRIVSRNFQLFTDFGEIEISNNEDGKTSMTVKGGADYVSESAPEDPAYTVQMTLGHNRNNPNSRFYVKTNSSNDYETSEFTMDNKGNILFETTSEFKRVVGGKDIVDVAQNQEVNVYGDQHVSVQGDATETVDGDKTTSAMNVTVSGYNKVYVSSWLTISVDALGQVSISAIGPVSISSDTMCTVSATGYVSVSASGVCKVSGAVVMLN